MSGTETGRRRAVAALAGGGGEMMTTDQVEILQHALGLDERRRRPWRNYFCAEEGAPQLEALVADGLMRRGRTINEGEDRYYIVTAAGQALALARLPEPKPLTRAQRRYRRFLDAHEANQDLTFRAFLGQGRAARG